MLKKLLILTALCAPTLTIAQSYVVYDFTHNRVLESHNANIARPIASVTKLMTAIVFLENNQNSNCKISITPDDTDHIKGTETKLPKYTPIQCYELLKAMLVSSDNYAAHALSRAANMTRSQFIQQMNNKARQLGMNSSKFIDSSGLSSGNISSPLDLVKLAKYAMAKPQIQTLSNTSFSHIRVGNHNILIKNTNKLVREEIFSAAVNKTGYIRESGYNLVFINKAKCNNATIGVISLNNVNSNYRSNFTKNKLQKYGCHTTYSKELKTSSDDALYEEGYDEEGMKALIELISN